MDMIASVISVYNKSLLVRDFKTNDKVIVLSQGGYNFSPGDCVRIKFNGKMVVGKPPKITAISIFEIECPD